MPSRITKAVFAFIATALALAVIVAAALGAWLMTGPKQLTQLLPYIEKSLNGADSPYRVEVGDVVASWEGGMQPVDFRLRDVTVYTREENAKLLKLPEMSVGLHMPSLLRLKLAPESIILHHPRMRFYRDEDNAFYVGFGRGGSDRVPLKQLLAGLGGDGKASGSALIGGIRYIGVQKAHFILGKEGQRLFDAKDANLRLSREGADIRAVLDLSFRYEDDKSSTIRGEMLLSDNPNVSMMVSKFELQEFSPHVLAQLFPDRPELAALDLPLNGWVDVMLGQSGEVSLVDFRVQGGEGTFSYDEHFAEPVAITSVRLEGQARDDFRHFVLSRGELDFGGATLTASGTARRHDEGWTAEALANARNMPVNDLYKYWPKTLSPTSYEWVTTHIREGIVPRAELVLKLTEDSLGEPFPASALAVTIAAEGVQVEYLDGHPKVEGVKGLVKFTGKGMTIQSQEGRMLSGSVLKDARLEIPDLTASPAPMHIRLAVEAPAKDVAAYIGIPELDFAAPLGLDPETISGTAAGKMRFDFVLPSRKDDDEEEGEQDDPQLTFLIDADVKDGAQPGFMGDKDLSDAGGKLTISEKELKYDGMMSISGAPLKVELTHQFHPEGEFTTEYHASGTMSLAQLNAAFGVPQLPSVTGNAGVDAHIRRTVKGGNRIRATADLAAVGAEIARIGFAKKAGQPATLELDAEAAEGTLALNAFTLKGNDIHVAGAARVGEEMSALQRLRLDRVEYGDNNLALDVERQGKGYKIRAKGASLDLAPLFAEQERQETEKEKDEAYAIDLDAQIDWVIFGKERELRQVQAQVQCNAEWCESADIRGVTGQRNHFAYEIKRVAGVRRVAFDAQNAGSFLKAVNLYDNMIGGALTMDGAFDDTAAGKPFKGKFRITENTIVNAPVLAKMASLLSLTGIGDALQGKGIGFREISGDVHFSDGLLKLSGGRAYGPALGITLEEGAVDLDSRRLRMNGTVVPSYTLNSVLGNIPLIGAALSGGKGEGVFAATYKVEGSYPDKVDVTVNPLTMLAPGFLRNVFGGVADTVAPQEKLPKEQAQEQAKEAEAEASQPLPQEIPPQEASQAE